MFRNAIALIVFPSLVWAAGDGYKLTIRDHRFEPAELRLPAGVKIKLIVENLDATPEEFESHALNREKVIPAKSRATLYLGPLSRGRYDFIGEFNPKTATGQLIVE